MGRAIASVLQVPLLFFPVELPSTVRVSELAFATRTIADEGTFDLVIVALRLAPEQTAAYSDELAKHNAGLPILLLKDHGVFAPNGTLSPSQEAGHPTELMSQIASMLAGSTYIRLVK